MSDVIRVLHVDDDPDFADLTATTLEREDDRFDVETATSVREALDRVAAEEVDCVVSGYEISGQNGIEFLEAVREDHSELPFILYTGEGSEAVASDAISAGVTDYLRTDAGTDQYAPLVDRIVDAVERHRTERAVVGARSQLAGGTGHSTDGSEGSEGSERTVQVRRLETLISNLPGVVYRCHNLQGWPMEFVRGECEPLTGYPPEALQDGDVSWGEDVIHPDDRERVWDSVQDAIRADSAFEVSYRIRTADGETKWVWERGRSVDARTEDGTHLEGFITGITERKERERELEEVNTLLSTLVETLPVGILAEDDARNVMAVNQRLVDLFDMPESPEELPGADCERMAEEVSDQFADPESFVDRIADVIAAGEPVSNEQLARENGRTFERSYRPLDLPDGSGHLWVYRDVTERTVFERELTRQNDRLEEFASVVSHDLRNPLNVATGRLELAREECDSDHLDAVQRAHDRMDALIDDLLTLAREGEAVSDRTSIDLTDFARSCWRNVETAEGTLVVEADRPVRADRSRLKQLFENLVRNAVEHAGPDVTVTVGTLEDGFYVEDDGPGIPPEKRTQMFEAGYSTLREGTGFGLSIVREVAEAHGWELDVTESEDGGARFEVTGVEFADDGVDG